MNSRIWHCLLQQTQQARSYFNSAELGRADEVPLLHFAEEMGNMCLRADAPTSKSAMRILSIGYDEMLLNTQKILLEKQGFEVWIAANFTQALATCAGNSFNTVILGCSVPHWQKEALLTLMRGDSHPMVISIDDGYDDELSLDGAEYELNPVVPPTLLISTVRGALQQNLFREALSRNSALVVQ